MSTDRPRPASYGDRTRIVLSLASAATGTTLQGVMDTLGLSVSITSAKLTELKRRKLLHGVKVAPLPTHYFADAGAAERWRQRQALKPAGHWQLNLPGTPKSTRPTGELRAPSTAQCPNWTHDPRYQVGPGERPYGAGFGAEWARLRSKPEEACGS